MTDSMLSAATYNIHGCVGTDRRYDPDRIAAVLAELDCDILGLQEVDNRRPRHGGLEQFDYLARRNGGAAIAGPAIQGRHGHYGNALFTRLPVAGIRRLDISHSKREPRGALDVDLLAPFGPLRVVVTHLGLDPRERRHQIARLLDALAFAPHAETPTLLLGDLNEWLPAGPRLAALARRFAAGFAGRSWPSALPLFRLDRIYAHPRPAMAEAAVHTSPLARRASDHLPFKVKLAWPVQQSPAPALELR